MLFEFLDTAFDFSGYVRGTRVVLPTGAPEIKHAAIFDPRDCFDKLRESFKGFSYMHCRMSVRILT